LITILIYSATSGYGQNTKSISRLNLIKQDSAKKAVSTILRYDSSNFELEIDQLIINETLSKAGNDFYELLYSKWTWPVGVKGTFMVVVSERPVFGNTTVLEITLNDARVYENFAQSRYDVLDELSTLAVETLIQSIMNYADIVKQLEGEDLAGTGIF